MTLRDELCDIIPHKKQDLVPSRFSLVGDVAVISIPPELEDQKKETGEAIISGHKNVKTVLRKISKLEGEKRVVTFEVLAGGGTVTIHREFDRAIVPTPYGRDDILGLTSSLVRPGGAIHFYTFKKRHQIDGLIKGFEDEGLLVEFHRRCGNVAPGVNRWAFDLVKL
jgi:tRNA G37 N-methylase Trm5